MSKPHPHSRFIDQLGGTAAVARITEQDMRVISNWRSRGIASRWRKPLAKLAERKGIAVPSRFIPAEPRVNIEAAA